MNKDDDREYKELIAKLEILTDNLDKLKPPTEQGLYQVLFELFATEAALKFTLHALTFFGKVMTNETAPKDENGALLITPPFYDEEDIERATFGKLIAMYEKLRPTKKILIVELGAICEVRNYVVHKMFFEKDPIGTLLQKMLESLKVKAIKNTVFDIIADIREATGQVDKIRL